MNHIEQIGSRRIISVDPGSTIGMVVLDDGAIVSALNVNYDVFWHNINHFLVHPNVRVVIEDMAAYSLRLTPQVISTIKFIGEAQYRLRMALSDDRVILTPRSAVKEWIFNEYLTVVGPMIEAKIKKGFDKSGKYVIKATGELRKPHFVFIDDRMVTEAMKFHYNIQTPKPGSGYEHGLKDHSWQSLGLATYWNEKNSTVV